MEAMCPPAVLCSRFGIQQFVSTVAVTTVFSVLVKAADRVQYPQGNFTQSMDLDLHDPVLKY